MAFLLMTFYFSVVIPRMWSRCVFNMPDEIFGASILWHLYRYYGILGHRSSHGSLARTGQVTRSLYRHISCNHFPWCGKIYYQYINHLLCTYYQISITNGWSCWSGISNWIWQKWNIYIFSSRWNWDTSFGRCMGKITFKSIL